MRYLLIDRIVAWKPGESIRGIKNVAMSEDFLEFHFPKNPIMPGVLMVEALAQLAGWLEAAGSEFSNWLLLTQVKKCSFYGFVLPGDRLELEITGRSVTDSTAIAYQGVGQVDGKRKVKATFEGELVPLGGIEDALEQKRFFQILTRELKF